VHVVPNMIVSMDGWKKRESACNRVTGIGDFLPQHCWKETLGLAGLDESKPKEEKGNLGCTTTWELCVVQGVTD
jgi:hypothetical protein